MFELFYPKEYIKSVYTHDFSVYHEKGFKLLLFDIDNTLTLHDEPATPLSILFIRALKEQGYYVGILSNNKGKRVTDFAQATECDYFIEDANKPNPRAYLKACKMFNLSNTQAVYVGDQIFTDIYGANLANIYSILTRPLGKEKYLHIKLKRFFEIPFINQIKNRG